MTIWFPEWKNSLPPPGADLEENSDYPGYEKFNMEARKYGKMAPPI
jgi:hypothetical protein